MAIIIILSTTFPKVLNKFSEISVNEVDWNYPKPWNSLSKSLGQGQTHCPKSCWISWPPIHLVTVGILQLWKPFTTLMSSRGASRKAWAFHMSVSSDPLLIVSTWSDKAPNPLGDIDMDDDQTAVGNAMNDYMQQSSQLLSWVYFMYCKLSDMLPK